MVVFEVAGDTWPVDDHTAEEIAVALRRKFADDRAGQDADAHASLAAAIESALVGAATHPIHVDEQAAQLLFLQLNASLKEPEAIDPAYTLYIEVRRYLGRLYS